MAPHAIRSQVLLVESWGLLRILRVRAGDVEAGDKHVSLAVLVLQSVLASKHDLGVVVGLRQRFPEPRTALQVHLFPHAGIIEQRKVRLDLPVYGYPEGDRKSTRLNSSH